MGMFDELTCKYPLPYPEIQDELFQTKDTDAQYLDHYEIREDGTLWHEDYDARMEFTAEAPLGMWLHRDNRRWVQVADYSGQLEIHHVMPNATGQDYWYSITFWFKAGKVADMIHSKSPCGLPVKIVNS